MSKADFDKYYTPTTMIEMCMAELLPLVHPNVLMIEPSAGDGRFVDYASLRGFNAKGYDLVPDTPKIATQDFLTSTKDTFGITNQPFVIYGNPPFGKGCSLAVRFFNHAAKLGADLIAFIIPASFGKKISIRERLDSRYSLYKSVPMHGHFERIDGVEYEGNSSLHCEFQIWFKKDRESVAIPEPLDYTIIRPKTNKVKVMREDGTMSNRELPVGDLDVDFTVITHGAKCGTTVDFNPEKDKSNVKQFVKVRDEKDVDKVRAKFDNADYSYFKESASIVGAQSCLATEEILLCVENVVEYRLKEWYTETQLYIKEKQHD